MGLYWHRDFNNVDEAIQQLRKDERLVSDLLIGDRLDQELSQKVTPALREGARLSNVMRYLHIDRLGDTLCAMRGLRHTGNTTIMFQAAQQLRNEGIEADRIAFVRADPEVDTMEKVVCTLDALYHCGVRHAFVDNATIMDDFYWRSKSITDSLCAMGLHVVVSGYETLRFVFASHDSLFDRIWSVRTNHIMMEDHVLSPCDFLKHGGIFYEDTSIGYKDTGDFLSPENARRYCDVAISDNIIKSMAMTSREHDSLIWVNKSYTKEELPDIIFRMLTTLNNRRMMPAITKTLEKHDPSLVASFQEHVGKTALDWNIPSVFSCESSGTRYLHEWLNRMNVFLDLPAKSHVDDWWRKDEEGICLVQPGLSFQLAMGMVETALQEAEKNGIILNGDKKAVIRKELEETVLAVVLENYLHMRSNAIINSREDREHWKVTRYRTPTGTCILVFWSDSHNRTILCEIQTHADVNTSLILQDDGFCESIERQSGAITAKFIVHTGEHIEANSGIQAVHVLDFGKEIDRAMDELLTKRIHFTEKGLFFRLDLDLYNLDEMPDYMQTPNVVRYALEIAKAKDEDDTNEYLVEFPMYVEEVAKMIKDKEAHAELLKEFGVNLDIEK